MAHLEFTNVPLHAKGPIECALMGAALLNSPFFNKGSAFSLEERSKFEIEGLLPAAVVSLEDQVIRAYGQLKKRGNDNLAKNTFLTSLRNQNLVLFYKVLEMYLEELLGIIYTPTAGDAIMQYSELFRRPDGCFLNISDSETRIETVLREWGNPEDIDYIVITDSEEILGIGDQGVGGIGICTAKLCLMTLCAGVHPNRTLPVVLDCGTDNQTLLNDRLYLGRRHKRVRGKAYDDFIDYFVRTVKRLYPLAVLHFEDFGISNGRRFLEKYRRLLPCINDDIQGTGAVTSAAIYTACKIINVPMRDIRMLIFGAGTAGTGIADMVRDAIASDGTKSKEEACSQIWLVDKIGLLLDSHKDQIHSFQRPYTKRDEGWKGKNTRNLREVIAHVKPHVLIGTSTVAGAFTEEVIREMARHVDRPVVFPLSNPTRLHEAHPRDVNAWTDGRALIATGSPFPPVEHNGKMYEVSECNNALCFPGLGLGCLLSRASICSDEMIVAASKALAALSPALADVDQALLPSFRDIKKISRKIAIQVIRAAVREGVARVPHIPAEESDEVLGEWVERQMWEPVYRPLKPVLAAGSTRAAKGLLGIGRRGSLRGDRDAIIE